MSRPEEALTSDHIRPSVSTGTASTFRVAPWVPDDHKALCFTAATHVELVRYIAEFLENCGPIYDPAWPLIPGKRVDFGMCSGTSTVKGRAAARN